MKAISTILAAAYCAASLPNNQEGVLAPADSKSQELKELLALDSYNVTSSDAEQNRMHAVCDMEYRLSKSRGIAGKDLGISNLLVTPAAPQFPWNPFTMPLAAVRAHIALLKQEETYLVAQSDAFEGKSTSASSTTATAVGEGIQISECFWIANDAAIDTPAEAVKSSAKGATEGIRCKFTSSKELATGQVLRVALDLGNTAGTPTLIAGTVASGATGALGAGLQPCLAGTDDQKTPEGACKGAGGALFTGAVPAQEELKKTQDGTTQTTAANTFEVVTAGTYAKHCTSAQGKCGVTKYTFSTGLDPVTNGNWFIGPFAALDTSNRKEAKVCFLTEQGTAAAGSPTAEVCKTIDAIA